MTPVVRTLLIANVLVFFLQATQPRLTNALVFVPQLVLVRPWSVITYMFLHGGLMHIAFNMLALWFFGPRVEERLGSRSFTFLYFISGLTGALLSFLFSSAPIVGASAGVFGVIMAAAFIAPQAIVVIPIPPIPLPLWMLAYGYVGIALFNLLSGGRNAGGDAAHLGGALAGYFFIRRTHLLRDFFDVFGSRSERAARAAADPRAPHAAEVDRILTKVREFGLASLDEEEKDVLRRHSEWLRRRR